MYLVLHIPTLASMTRAEFLRAALAGLAAHNDAGESIVGAIEAHVADDEENTRAEGCDALMSARCADALAAHHGNVSAAARSLGVARSTLRARAARHAAANDNAARQTPQHPRKAVS